MNNQRKIKFRAWDKQSKKMWFDVQDAYDTLHDHCLHSELERETCDCRSNESFMPSSFGQVLKDDDLEVMQYTGLKDKNGKEIYEGDIIDFGGLRPIEIIWRMAGFESKLIPFENSNPIALSQEGM